MKQEINLLPPQYIAGQTFNWKKHSFAAAVAVLLVLLAASSIFLKIDAASLQSEIADLNRQKVVGDATVKIMQEEQQEIADLKAKISVLQKLPEKDVSWYYLLREITGSLPEGIWLNQLAGDGQKIQINGTSTNNADIGVFIIELNKLPSIGEVILVQAETNTMQNQEVTTFELIAYFQ